MATSSPRQPVPRTARVLIAGQIIAAMAAVAAVVWAVQAELDRGKARAAADSALAEARAQAEVASNAAEALEAARAEVLGAQAEAVGARRLAKAHALISARSRTILLAASPGDFRQVALEIDNELSELTYDGVPRLGEGAEVAILSLLAMAQFRSDLPDHHSKALESIERAIRLNDARLAQAESLARLDLNEGIYLDKLSYICAARPGDVAALRSALDAFPAEVITALAGTGRRAQHYSLRSACSSDAQTAISEGLDKLAGAGKAASQAELFKIRRIFINAESDALLPFAERAGEALHPDYELQGFASMGGSYWPGVRYYYPDQKTEAEAIARRVQEAYGEAWPDIRFDAVLLKGYQGLARDQVEVWLPAPRPPSSSPT